MKKLAFIPLIFLSCSKVPARSGATPSYLAERPYTCASYPESIMSEVKSSIPQNMVRGWEGQDLEVFYKYYAGIPKSYRDWLAKNYQGGSFKGIYPQYTTKGWTGLTMLMSNGGPWYPQYITIASNGNKAHNIAFALQHEVGHAVQSQTEFSEVGKSNNLARSIQNLALIEGSRNPSVRSYAKTQDRNGRFTEYFAEAFSNFYCSEESYAFLKNQLPQTYALLAKTLTPPIWKANTNYVTPRNKVDLGVALGPSEETGKFRLYAGVAAGVEGVDFCFTSGATSCTDSKDMVVKGERVQSLGERVAFAVPNLVNLDQGKTYTLVVRQYDGNGKITGEKPVRIAKNG
jgi:hypothetical protein